MKGIKPGTYPSHLDTPPQVTKSNYVLVVSIVNAVVGALFMTLCACHIFGSVGSIGYILAISAGGLMTLSALSVFIFTAVASCKDKKEVQKSALLEEVKKKEDLVEDKVAKKIVASCKDKKEVQKSALLEEVKKKEDLIEDTVAKKIVSFETVISKLNEEYQKNTTLKTVVTELKKIESSFFEEKMQERAKEIFSYAMKTILGSEVSFPKPCFLLFDPNTLTGQLNSDVFHLSATTGVEKDIPKSSQDSKNVHVFQVASQYNAAEAPSAYTPPIGEAMVKSNGDYTQGPLAQRTNPVAFELVTAFLTHLGYNMLEQVVPSAGTTYTKGSCIEHGYLRPTKESNVKITQEFKNNYEWQECVCYSSFDKSWKGVKPVYIFLQAAPAIGYMFETMPTDELQKYAALSNYLAFFQHGINLAQEKKEPVVLHATAVGGGVFGNAVENLQWGFEKAALFFQKELKENNVKVQLENFVSSTCSKIAKNLGIPNGNRIGE